MSVSRCKIKPVIAMLLFLLLLVFSAAAFSESGEAGAPVQPSLHLCTRVIDGDTLIVDYKIKVRLLGVDTPEAGEFFFEEAKEFLKKAASGRKVEIRFDRRKNDKFGRVLAYVYLEDGTFLNEEIIKRGFGEVFYSDDYMYKKNFIELQREAKMKKTGIWSR